jgi:hypothetical protein
VYRGKIPDEEVEQILVERNRIDSRCYSFLQENPISEEEHKKELSLLQERLAGLARRSKMNGESPLCQYDVRHLPLIN